MNKDFLKSLLITAKAIDAPPHEPSERAKKLFEETLARHQPAKVLSEDQMKVVILQILTKGSGDGADIIEKLNELKVRLEMQGEGVVYALLARMEEEGLIAGQFDATMSRKSYRLTDKGSDLLNREGESVRTISELVATLWAT